MSEKGVKCGAAAVLKQREERHGEALTEERNTLSETP
jgi:hypothetical protein